MQPKRGNHWSDHRASGGNETLHVDEQQLLSAVETPDDQLTKTKWPPKVEPRVGALIARDKRVATDLRGVLASGLTAVATQRLGIDGAVVSRASQAVRGYLGLLPPR
jgi:hypothetical protein